MPVTTDFIAHTRYYCVKCVSAFLSRRTSNRKQRFPDNNRVTRDKSLVMRRNHLLPISSYTSARVASHCPRIRWRLLQVNRVLWTDNLTVHSEFCSIYRSKMSTSHFVKFLSRQEVFTSVSESKEYSLLFQLTRKNCINYCFMK